MEKGGNMHHRHSGLSEQPGHHQHVATLSTARPGRGAQKGRASGRCKIVCDTTVRKWNCH
jgi:hypothetical protein